MPTYHYRCSTCGLDFELNQSFSEDSLSKCPTKKSGRSPDGCTTPGRGKVEKVFSAPGISFKGSGFYKTDSRSSSSSTTSGSKSGSDSSKGDSGSSKGESGSKAPAPTGSTDS